MIKRLLSIICFFCISFLYSYELVFASPINGECAPTHYNCNSGVWGGSEGSGGCTDGKTIEYHWDCNGVGGGSKVTCF
ncbi:MAG: hypothetical protein PHW52_02950 [Candidatus Pacebacteria bacterium]|nr:hypothetical protein [Candidatus Paceibacterota bacterium]